MGKWGESAPPACMWCERPSTFARAGSSTGFKVTAWCFICSKPATPRLAYPKGDFTAEQLANLPAVQASPLGQCQVCKGAAYTERHHLAPRELFGDECELWPTVDVCRPCHARWHERMGRPIGLPEAAED